MLAASPRPSSWQHGRNFASGMAGRLAPMDQALPAVAKGNLFYIPLTASSATPAHLDGMNDHAASSEKPAPGDEPRPPATGVRAGRHQPRRRAQPTTGRCRARSSPASGGLQPSRRPAQGAGRKTWRPAATQDKVVRRITALARATPACREIHVTPRSRPRRSDRNPLPDAGPSRFRKMDG